MLHEDFALINSVQIRPNSRNTHISFERIQNFAPFPTLLAKSLMIKPVVEIWVPVVTISIFHQIIWVYSVFGDVEFKPSVRIMLDSVKLDKMRNKFWNITRFWGTKSGKFHLSKIWKERVNTKCGDCMVIVTPQLCNGIQSEAWWDGN